MTASDDVEEGIRNDRENRRTVLDTIVAMMGVLLPSIVHGTLLHEAFAIDH
jgi:hypothetical protein